MRISDWSSDVCSSDLQGQKPATIRMRLMFAVDFPVASFYARFSGCSHEPRRTARIREPQEVIRQALAEMVPSTAEEIAEATGLDPVVVDATLDRMAARYRETGRAACRERVCQYV